MAQYTDSSICTWEEEYNSYKEECERLKLTRWDLYSPSMEEYHLQHELTKHKRYNKKCKRQKDYKTWVWNSKGCWWELRFKTHKHLQAQKEYTEDEYFEDVYFDVPDGGWFVYNRSNDTYEFDINETNDDYTNWLLCGDDYFDYLYTDEWKEYVASETGRVLDSWEMDSVPRCNVCG